MSFISNNIEVKRTARYYTNEPDFNSVDEIWFILHGYGLLAQNFIKKFSFLDNAHTLIVAPEALNRFYLDNGFGRVGASWMTREDKDFEIGDYSEYLTSLYNSIIINFPKNKIKLKVFGFSQGTSTASRWLQISGIKADTLILWGGFFPPEYQFEIESLSFDNLLLITGKDDEYMSPERLEEGKKILDSYSVKYTTEIYDGGHEMKEEVVVNLLSRFLK